MIEWIKTSDCEPEIGSFVVAWLSKRKEPVCCRIEKDPLGLIYRELVEVSIFADREDIITHWLPLPKPPKDK